MLVTNVKSDLVPAAIVGGRRDGGRGGRLVPHLAIFDLNDSPGRKFPSFKEAVRERVLCRLRLQRQSKDGDRRKDHRAALEAVVHLSRIERIESLFRSCRSDSGLEISSEMAAGCRAEVNVRGTGWW